MTIRIMLIVAAVLLLILDGIRLPVSVNLQSLAFACLAGTLLV